MLTIFAPFLLAAISGLAFLALKHPSVYEKLFNKVYALSGVAFLVLVVWTSAVGAAFTALSSYIPPDKIGAAKAAIDAVSVPVPWLLLAQIAVMAYLFFLSWLAHQILESEKEKKNDL